MQASLMGKKMCVQAVAGKLFLDYAVECSR